MTEEQRDEAMDRIRVIDAMFAAATGWGSWMVMCAREREALVDRLRANGLPIARKWRVQLSNGVHTS